MESLTAKILLDIIAIAMVICGVWIVKHAYDSSLEMSIFPWQLDSTSKDIAWVGAFLFALGVVIAVATYFA